MRAAESLFDELPQNGDEEIEGMKNLPASMDLMKQNSIKMGSIISPMIFLNQAMIANNISFSSLQEKEMQSS